MSLMMRRPKVASASDGTEFVNDPRFRKAGEIVNQIYLLLDKGKKEEARKLFADNEKLIVEHSHAPNYVIRHLRDKVNAATDAIDPKELGRRELAIASKINNDITELHFVLQAGANYAYELKSKNPNEYKLESELLGRDLFSYYMNALNNHKQGAALIRNAIGHR